MPSYSYRCRECMAEYTAPRTIGNRDAPFQCARCLFNDIENWCERIPDAPAFTITGYNAKNGYTKE